MSHEVPQRPWQKIGVDLFTIHGKDYLITVDYFSNFWEVDYLENTSSQTVIRKLKAHFARYGIVDSLVCDNGPQFSSAEFANFSNKWEFQVFYASPGNPKANGKAESAVK
jgi:IS30 family transposase